MTDFYCGQCGSQCDDCKTAEAADKEAKRRNRIADIVCNIGIGLSIAGAGQTFISTKIGLPLLGIGALMIVVGTTMHEVERIVQDNEIV